MLLAPAASALLCGAAAVAVGHGMLAKVAGNIDRHASTCPPYSAAASRPQQRCSGSCHASARQGFGKCSSTLAMQKSMQ
jgi:hypothetical protein